jgi:hypothetical protein
VNGVADVFKLLGTIAVNNSSALTAISQTAKEAAGLGGAFGKGERAAGKSLAQIAAESGKTVNQLRSEAMKAAAEYQKQGMTASEAMRKAYADIGYSAELAHKKMDKNMDDSADNAEKTANKMSDVFKKIGKVVAAAFSVKAVVDFGKQCTQTYASIAAEESAFAQIMGDYADTARDKLNAVADQTGVSATRMTGAMTSLTAKFKGLGYNVEDATTLATDGLLIASDAAAFWDMSLDESMSHLNSFINGSYEGGEAIGLFANDTQMAAYAVEKGIVADAKAWAQLDEATKQATRLDYAKNMQQMSGATGQAAKESQEYANVMANLKEGWRQFQGVIGKPILEKIVLPALRKLNDFMPVLTESVAKGIEWLETGFDKIAAFFKETFSEDGLKLDALPKALTKMFQDVRSKIPGLLSSVGSKIRSAWTNTVWPAIQKLFKAAFGVELPDWAQVKQDISDGWNNKIWPYVQDYFKQNFGVEIPSWADITTSITDGWNNTIEPKIKDFFKKVFSIELPSWTEIVTSITNAWKGTIKPAITDFFTKPFDITLPSWTEIKTNISSGWNDTIWPAIQNFFAKNFDITLPSWDEIKTNISSGWTDTIWPAIQHYFKRNFDVTLPSWDEIVTNITNAWNDTIQPAIADFFTKPFGITLPSWTEIKTSISGGWTDTIWPAIQHFFAVNFDVKLPTWSEIITAITDAWNNTVVPAISGLFKAVFGVEPADSDGTEVGKKLREWWALVVGYLGDIFGAVFGVDTEDENGATTGEKIKNWWKAVVDFVGNIFRGIFGVDPDNPTSVANNIISWFEDVLASVGDIFFAIFGLNTAETDDESSKLKTWFTGLMTAIGDFFRAVFGLTLPVWDQVAKDISDGWNNTVWPGIMNFFKQTFGITLPTWSDLVTDISDGWNNTVWPGIMDFFKQLFKLELPSFSEVASSIKTWWADVTKSVGEIFNAVFGISTDNSDSGIATTVENIKTWFSNVLAAAGDVFNVIAGVIGGAISTARSNITSWWNRVKSGLNLSVTASVQTVYDGVQEHTAYQGGYGESAGGKGSTLPGTLGGAGAMVSAYGDGMGGGSGSLIKGFATGLDYVPRDNYPALLHKGEAVLTRNEADVWRTGGNANGIVAALAQVENLLRDIAANTGADRAVVMDTGALVGQLASGMDAKLGQMSNRKGRGR